MGMKNWRGMVGVIEVITLQSGKREGIFRQHGKQEIFSHRGENFASVNALRVARHKKHLAQAQFQARKAARPVEAIHTDWDVADLSQQAAEVTPIAKKNGWFDIEGKKVRNSPVNAAAILTSMWK